MTSTKSAQEIYQALLDKTGDALMARDFDAYASYFFLPHSVQTFEGRLMIRTRDELKVIYNGVVSELDLHNVLLIERVCSKAEFARDDVITGFYETRLLVKGMHVVQTYFALGTLRLAGGDWLVGDGQYAGPDKTLPHAFLGRLIEQEEKKIQDPVKGE